MIEPVVSRARWQQRHPDAVLVDVRRDVPGRTAAQAYAAGHLPGAVLVDLERWLAGPPSPEAGRHPLPTPEAFAEGMSRAGIGDDDTVVAYDDSRGVIAARLVWMLRALGRSAALLDGVPAPEDDLVTEPVTRPRAVATPLAWPAELLAGPDDATSSANVVLDARSRERYLGVPDPLDPRPGHLPGARSLPCLDTVDDRGRLLPVGLLRDRLAAAGVTGTAPVVATCGSGVTACHTLLVIEHLGLGTGRLYPGSWSQYASDPGRPVELGEPAT